MTWRVWLPLALFAGFLALAAYQMSRPKSDFVASRMIGEPVPFFDLRAATEGKPGLASKTLADGRPRLLNIFASWCVPCRAEAPQLEALRRRGVTIVGVATRDRPEDVARFLAENGDPYAAIGADDLSEVMFALGASGVPETFVIDGKGVVRYQHIGDIRADDVPRLIAQIEEIR